MANSNKKINLGQGKTPQQYEDSAKFAWYGVVGMIVLLILLSSCGTTKECCGNSHAIIEHYENN